MTTTIPISFEGNTEAIAAVCLRLPQVECPVTNIFAAGIYWREMAIPAGTFAMGHKHKTEHVNVMLTGRVRVLADGKVKELTAPQVFVSPAGTKKMVLALEDTRWANIHANPDDLQDMDLLEERFIEKSAAWLDYQAEVKQLKGGK